VISAGGVVHRLTAVSGTSYTGTFAFSMVLSNYVLKSGDTMTGDLNLSGSAALVAGNYSSSRGIRLYSDEITIRGNSGDARAASFTREGVTWYKDRTGQWDAPSAGSWKAFVRSSSANSSYSALIFQQYFGGRWNNVAQLRYSTANSVGEWVMTPADIVS